MGSRDAFVEVADFSISIDFQPDFCKAFLVRPSFDTLGSILPRQRGEEALEPFLEPPRDPLVFELGLGVFEEPELPPFCFAELLLLFFFMEVPSDNDGALADFDLEFCRPTLVPELRGEVTELFLATFGKGRFSSFTGIFSCFTGDFFGPEERLRSLVRIGDPLEEAFANLAADSASAFLMYCLIHCLTPFNVLQGEQGSRVHGLDSVRSRIEMTRYLPHSSYTTGQYRGGVSNMGGGLARPQSLLA